MSPDAEMAEVSALPPSSGKTKTPKSHTLHTTTLKHPPFAYAHLQLSTNPPPSSSSSQSQLDNLQLIAYLTAALRQFLGDHGAAAAVGIDILKVQGVDCWVRLPRRDLGVFAAAVTAYPGTTTTQGMSLMRLVGAGDWLGLVVGRHGEGGVWGA